jgi:hypothetical protein
MTAIRPGARALPQSGAAHPPPFILPAEHFGAALVWLLLGTGGLVLVAPDLANGNYLAPRVLAVTHVMTLGVITTTIFGALYQFFPGALGVELRSVPIAHLSFAAHVMGTATLVAGFWFWRPALLGLAWLLLLAGVLGVLWNLLPQRRKATRGRIVGRYVSAAQIALVTAMLLAAARIGEALGWWAVDRMGIIIAHFHLAALGFGTFTVVGVGSWMLAAFLKASTAPTWPLRWIGPVGLVGLTLLTIAAFVPLGLLRQSASALLFGSAALCVLQLGGYFRHAQSGRLDPALGHVAAALGSLLGAVALGGVILAGEGSARVQTAYALLAILWLVLFITGVMLKILPFLMWMNWFGPRKEQAGGPTLQVLTPPTLVRASLTCLSLGTAGMAGGILSGSTPITRTGALALAAGVVCLHAQYVRMLLRARRLRASGS